jgi:hypothetical protein
MKWVRAFLWIVIFIGLTMIGDALAEVSGIGVVVTRSILPTAGVTYSRAYSTLATVDMVLSILFATAVLLAVYAIRRPGAIRARVQSFNERMRNPSVRDLVVLWVISPFTFYVPAIYATWHFFALRRVRPPADSATSPLVARLAQLDSARQAGLISADEHETKRAQILDAY